MEIHSTEMSQGENDHEKVLQRLFLDQTEIDPTEISQGDNDYEEVLQRLGDGAQKCKFFFSSACICRVPKELRKLNESAYTPRLVAIGPLHQNDPHLQTPMQHVKLSYANTLFCRLTEGVKNPELAKQIKSTALGECMEAMKTSIDDAKKCYPEKVQLDEDMMMIDGCFILEFLYRYFGGKVPRNSEEADPIFGNSSTRITIQHDLLLLENQIPFFALERLYPLTLARIPNLSFKNLTDYVFLGKVFYDMRPMERNSTNSGSAKSSCWPRDCVLWVPCNKMNNSKEEEVSSRTNANYYHILHKLHDDFLPHHKTGKGRLRRYMPSASELHYAGVKFVPGTGNNLFKVNFTEPGGPFWWFRSAHFEIPPLKIVDTTEPFLRNFIAFEQCCPGISQHFTSYATLMDMLVNSDIDVQVLEKAGVVNNWLGASEDVTDLFNKLCKGVVLGEFFFADTCNRATRYSKRFWPNHMANLRRQYFASPWKFIAFCLAFVYFGVTIAQLIISIIK